MSLDLEQVASQIADMAGSLQARKADREIKLNFALNVMRSLPEDVEKLKQKIEASKTTWLVAGVTESINVSKGPVPCPEDVTVVATDGSQIDVDRHYSAHCFLINIGIVRLDYGRYADAQLSNRPMLYYKDEEMVIASEDGRKQIIEGPLLGLKRTIEEYCMLKEQAIHLPEVSPALLLVDGSLVLWTILQQPYPDFVIQEILVDGLVKQLDELKNMNARRQLALASYISFPRSTEVVNTLRIAMCPFEPVNCDANCPASKGHKECDAVDGLLDRELFEECLAPGERSATFSSRSSVVRTYYREHEVHFFYVKIDGEIARVEVPLWIAANEELTDFVHTMVLEQCKKGMGYPVALSEAHEKAVVTDVDRSQFWRLVEQFYSGGDLALTTSAKQRSKRMRWI
jgi:hypothetical protein